MKKFVFAILAMFAAVSYAGEYGDVKLGTTTMKDSNVRTDHAIVTYGSDLGKWNLEGRVGMNRTADTSTNSDMAELRARYNFGQTVFGLKPFVRGTAGEAMPNGTHFSYWGAEAGVGRSWTNSLSSEVSVIRSEAWKNDNRAFDTTSYRLANSYAFDKKNSVGLNLAHTAVGLKSDMVEVGFTRRF